LRFPIVRGFRRLEPTVDFLAAQGLIPDAMEDPDVLSLAANLQRVLVSHDYETMPGHFYRFLQNRESPGLILIPQQWPIGLSIERLHAVWASSDAELFRNRIVYLAL
jgi:hypothetical protein